ncbi:MAG: lamin tail domain-containing protein [Bacteroidota bacterium]
MKRKLLLSLLLFVLFAGTAFSQGIVITEINYNDPSTGTTTGDSLEYIEVQNFSTMPVNFGGYKFTSGVTFTFPSMTVPAMGYVVIAKAATKVQNFYGISGVLQWDAGQTLTNNGGEGIALKDPSLNMLDTVRYNTTNPWPTSPNGTGPSLMLCDASLDNNNGANWVAANAVNSNTYGTIAGYVVNGTPGSGCVVLPPYFPKFANVPFTATFENTWKNANYSRDVPDTVWTNSPSSGNNSWRRNDDGISAVWTGTTTGAYTPTGAIGSSRSARFHSSASVAGQIGDLTLLINMNTPGIKRLKFWQMNTSGNDSLGVFFSQDSGLTYTHIGQFVNTTTWEQKQILLGATTATHCMIRFRATAQVGNTDIGLDDVVVDLMMPDDVGVTSIAAPGPVVAAQTDTIKVILKNYGGNDVSNVNINWSVGGILQTPVAYSSVIPSGATSAMIKLGAFTFPPTGPMTIKAWTSLPNGNADTDPTNDTASSSTYFQPYASIPFYEGFDSTWFSKQASRDVPSNYWAASPATGNQSFRRDDDGVSAAWGNTTVGAYTPAGALTTTHSARFHTGGIATTGPQGSLSLYVNFNVPGIKVLHFYHINTAGTDSLTVAISYDGGATFSLLGKPLVDATWNLFEYIIGNNTSSNTVIRFRASSNQNGNTDVGLDEVSLYLLQPNNTGITSIDNPSPILNNATDTVKVHIRNYGANAVTTANINWSVNGILQTVVPFTGNIPAQSNSGLITVGGYTFPTSGQNVIKVWTSQPNGVPDTEPINDTLKKTVIYQPYATIPFYDGFDSAWINKLGTRDVSSYFWVNTPVTGNTSWRRSDDGAAAAWTTPTGGAYTPSGALSTTQSARFHTASATAGSPGTLDLYINLSTAGNKELRFYHINSSGNDSVAIYLSQNGGSSFTYLTKFINSTSWAPRVVTLGNLTASQCVIRFKVTSPGGGFGLNDVGIDEVRVDLVKPDVGVSKLLKPFSGCGLSANDTIKVRVKNFGNLAASNIAVQSPAGIFTITNTLQPGDSIDFEVGTITVPPASSYLLKIYTSYPDDPNALNDTLKYTLVHYMVIDTFPYVDNFENGLNFFTKINTATNAQVSILPSIGTSASHALFMTGIVGGTWPQNTATNTTPEQAFAYADHKGEFVSSCMVDATNLPTPELRIDLKQTYSAGIAYSYFRVTVNDTMIIPDQTGKLYFNPTTQHGDPFVNRHFDLSQFGGTTFKLSLISACKYNAPNAQSGIADAAIVDNFSIRAKVPTDAGMVQVLSPISGCGLGNEVLGVRIVNFGSQLLPVVPVAYTINGGPVHQQLYAIPLNPGDTLNFNFDTLVNMSTPGVYNITAYVALMDDMEHINDTVHFQVVNIPMVHTFPYVQDFESDFTGWISGAISGTNEWELGIPSKTFLNGTHSGQKAWTTGLTQNYNINTNCYVQSPCFDLVGMTNPILSVWLKFQSELDYDGMIVESTIDNGASWVKLPGDAGFYNGTSVNPPLVGAKWSGTNGGWVLYKTSLAAFDTVSNAKFRFRFASDNANNDEGFEFDDFRIREAAVDLITTYVSPMSNCSLGINELITVSVRNDGEKIAPYAAYYYSFGGPTYVDSIGGNILPGAVVTHTTWYSANMAATGTLYTLNMDVHTAGESDPINNAVTQQVRHLSPITGLVVFDGFEFPSEYLAFEHNTNAAAEALPGNAYNSIFSGHLEGGAAGTWPTGTATSTPADSAFKHADHLSKISTCDVNLPSSVYPAVYLRFMLKQTYSLGADYSWLRVLINDTTPVASTSGVTNYQAATAAGDPYTQVMYDLTSFYGAGTLHKITIESACMFDKANSSTGIADAAYIDNYILDFADGIHTVQPAMFSVTPNPTHDLIRVDLINANDGQMILMDIMGRIVSTKVLNGQHVEVIDMRDLPAGIYALRINTLSGNQTVKVVKE